MRYIIPLVVIPGASFHLVMSVCLMSAGRKPEPSQLTPFNVWVQLPQAPSGCLSYLTYLYQGFHCKSARARPLFPTGSVSGSCASQSSTHYTDFPPGYVTLSQFNTLTSTTCVQWDLGIARRQFYWREEWWKSSFRVPFTLSFYWDFSKTSQDGSKQIREEGDRGY